MDNVTRVMKKIEPEKREEVFKSLLGSYVFKTIQQCYSPEEFVSDIFVNCNTESSWELLATELYHHHQMAAVDEVRPYLPPRGES